jgi:pyruvate,orthophosphate dikinase
MPSRPSSFGAEGIGLCRTEHMFFDTARIPAMREMIVAETEEQRKQGAGQAPADAAQRFRGLYEAMRGLPVTIRYLDPAAARVPPDRSRGYRDLAKEMASPREAATRHREPARVQPDARPPRLPPRVTYPEIAEMQTHASSRPHQ